MSDCQRLLSVLSDGRRHSHRELYRLGMIVHSRAAELRARGNRIDVDVETLPSGQRLYFYQLVRPVSGNGKPDGLNPSETLREARVARGLSLRDLAAESGISRGILSLIEREKLTATPDQLAALGRTLGVGLVAHGRPVVKVAA